MTTTIQSVSEQLESITMQLLSLIESISGQPATVVEAQLYSPFIVCLTIFILAVFVGYHVVWKVTPALHAPLMSITNVISSVIIVGALLGSGYSTTNLGLFLSCTSLFLASINISGGYEITKRMLDMFSQKR